MRFFYSIGIAIYTLGVRIASCWIEKAKLMVQGWRHTQSVLDHWPLHGPTVWFHASSMGEFEQARPVLERYKAQHPDHKILVTFFSPSGYEVRKNYPHADLILYLPMDSMHNAQQWVKIVKPVKVFFVKYDFWFNYLHYLNRAQVPTFIFSAIFRKQQYFFKSYGRWFAHQLQNYSHLFVQNQESIDLLHSVGIQQCSLAGDTRFDQVNAIASQAKRFSEIEQFIGQRKVLMAGSSWEPDEANIKHFIESYPTPLCLILAPHVISTQHLDAIERLFGPERCTRYSKIKERSSSTDVLIIDNIGMLSALYQYATVAYIGGGFGRGIHNTLEALTFGKPVCFGPKYQKFQEARDIISRGGGFSYSKADELTDRLSAWFNNEDLYKKASVQSRAYVESNLGSADTILSVTESKQAIGNTDQSVNMGKLMKTILAVLATSLMLVSCSVTKYMNEDDRLLTHNKYTIIHDDIESERGVNEALNDVQNYTIQNPNSSFLGIYRHKLHVYSLSSPNDSSWINNFLRRRGEPPVVFDENAALLTTRKIEGLLQSKGCFNSEVSFDTVHYGNQRLKTYYIIHPTPRYTINEVSYTAESKNAQEFLDRWKNNSDIHPGDFYDQKVLSDERNTIVEMMQMQGFYHANISLVSFSIDTNLSTNQLNIELHLANPVIYDEANRPTTIPLKQYVVDKIYIYPNSTAASSLGGSYDTMAYEYRTRLGRSKCFFVYNQPMTLRPQTIARSLSIFSDRYYSSMSVQRTNNSLLNLRNFKYINFDFIESPLSNHHPDSIGRVDARIRLKNNTKQKISLSLEVNNSSPNWISNDGNSANSTGNLGAEVILSYQNKNTFGGAELLKVEGSFLIELPNLLGSRNIPTHWSAFESGLDASLDIPRLLLPSIWGIGQRTKPHTIINFGTFYQDRYYFERLLANTSFGYSWNSTQKEQHQILPIELTFARFFDIDSLFWNRIEQSTSSSRLKYQYSNHFIMDARYDYVYSNQTMQSRRDFTYFHLSIESAGNLLYGVGQSGILPTDTSGVFEIYGVPFSQYLRLNSEFKHYFFFGKRSTFVARMLLGIGMPYGNSENMQMPYEKSFFGGGPLSMRAWHLRRLGPGFYSPEGNSLLERTGDMTFVLNLETRFPILSKLEGALFADIGNVWLMYPNSDMPGGEFNIHTFLPSMAIGSGIGLRLNVSILTLRLDVGIPVYDPAFDKGLRWRYRHWNTYPFSIAEAHFGPFTLNFGIDYPF